MIFLHLVNLVTRTHETDETQWISFAAASRATCLVAVKGQVAKLFEHVSERHLTHFNTTHLPKEPVNFKAKGAFMTAVSYKIILYLYPPT